MVNKRMFFFLVRFRKGLYLTELELLAKTKILCFDIFKLIIFSEIVRGYINNRLYVIGPVIIFLCPGKLIPICIISIVYMKIQINVKDL